MAKRRPVKNPLALAVLTFLSTRPMYPYEIASALKSTGKDLTIKINWGSLYTVVQNLQKHGLVAEAGTTRQGARPERTAYTITEAGRAEMRDWLGELLSEPQQEHPLFAIALSLVAALPPDAAIDRLERRLGTLEAEITTTREELAQWSAEVPRLFLIEVEYAAAMREAEAAWIRGLLADFRGDMRQDVEQWGEFHRSGRLPDGFPDLAPPDGPEVRTDGPEARADGRGDSGERAQDDAGGREGATPD